MKKNILIIAGVFIVFLAFLTSCSAVVNSYLTSQGIYEEKVNFVHLQRGDKDVLLIPSKHFGPEEFYVNLKRSVDSLTQSGYVFFYEGIKIRELKTTEDTLQLREEMLKYRRIIGKSFSPLADDGGIIDTLNNRLRIGDRTVKMKRKVVPQPSSDYFFKDKREFEVVDLTVGEMLVEYERRYGEVVLTDCDYETDARASYECENEGVSKNSRRFVSEIGLDYRNEHVVSEILASEHHKIAVIYGYNHIKGLKVLLEENEFE